MKKMLCLLSVIVFLALAGQVMAYTIKLNPVTQVIGLGKTATVNIEMNIENLQFPDLILLDLIYDKSILGLNSVSFDPSYFGVSVDTGASLGLAAYLFNDTPSTNIFTLASLNFTGNAYGFSPLFLSGSVQNYIVPDSVETISLNPDTGGVGVVPEPGTFLLLGLGLAGLVGYRKKFRKL